MTIGCLGNVNFKVSSKTVQTLKSIKMKKTANYAVHNRVGKKSLLEFTGLEPDEISFTVDLSVFQGVKPENTLKKLDKMISKGQAVPFILGTTVFGSGDWVITSLDKSYDWIYRDGELLSAKVNLTIKEYSMK